MISDATLERVLPRHVVALVGDLVRAALWGVVVVTWIVFAQIYVRLWRLTIADPAHSDFTIFYYTARLVADGFPMYGASPARYGIEWAAGHLGNLNPPHVQMFLQPLAELSYRPAYTVWTAVNVGSLAMAVALVVQTTGIRLTWQRFLVGGALLGGAAPFTVVAVTSELTFLLLLPFTLAWASAVRGRWVRAGAWLGVCVAWKLFFLLFVPWLVLQRRWAALAACGGAVATWLALGLAVHGVDTYRLWLGSLGTVGWWWLPMNASWQGLISRLVVGGRTVEPLVRAPSLLGPIGGAGSIVISTISIWAGHHLLRRHDAVHAAVLVVMLGAVLASPLGWIYYVPLALGPVVGLIASGEWRSVPRNWLFASAGAAAVLYIPLEQAAAGQPSVAATLTLASLYFYGVTVPWMGLVATACALPKR
jgi:hypothetical protein